MASLQESGICVYESVLGGGGIAANSPIRQHWTIAGEDYKNRKISRLIPAPLLHVSEKASI